MNFIVLEAEKFEKLTSEITEIKEAIQNKTEQDLAASFIESKKIPKLLGISLKTWQTYRDKGTIPFIQFGSKIWVKRADLEAFLNEHYVTKSVHAKEAVK
ncbi:MAG: helix-turn-helix domain-containing protein [Bacteroidota bacterium]|nr:helix-turn-helix domain-containing protein [Bacteroidota bacterium]